MSAFAMWTLGLIIGAAVSTIAAKLLNRTDPVGTLEIIECKGEDAHMFLSLNREVEKVAHKQTITLRVSHKRVSHK